MRSFDCVSMDSDLDSVCTQQVREHVRRSGEEPRKEKYNLMDLLLDFEIQTEVSQVSPTGWRSLLRSVTGLDSDLDVASLDDGEAPAATQQRVHAHCKTQT